MASRDDKNRPSGSSARSRQRGKPVQVQPKKPIGAIVGGSVLGVALIGVLVFAVMNQGTAFEDPIDRIDSSFDGLVVSAEEDLARDHVSGPVDYPSLPPAGGEHNGTPQTCAVYDAPIAPEHAVHSLEHGAAWITYNDDASEEDVETLRELAQGEAYVLMSPLPEQESPIVVTAWGRQLSADSADDPQVEEFVEGYANGPQTPEKGAACVGNTTTGSLGGAPAAPSVTTTVEPAPAASASPATS